MLYARRQLFPADDRWRGLNVVAGNGVGTAAKQTFTLTVNQPPSFSSGTSKTFTVGQADSFSITTTAGVPATTTVTETGKLPTGISFVAGAQGKATLSGTPAAGTGGT